MGRKGCLCTDVAIQGYIMLLSSLIEYMEAKKGLDPKHLTPKEIILEIEEYIDPVLKFLSDAPDFLMEKTFKVPYGSGGPPEYHFQLCQLVKQNFSDFSPIGMHDWLEEKSEERIKTADRKLKEINVEVQKCIFDSFKEKYGVENNAFWNEGVLVKSIKVKAYETSLDDDNDQRLPLENYLNFIDYKRIVENKRHWHLFKDVFDIPERGEKGLAKNLKWMTRVNELRCISAHPTELRHYKKDGLDYIDFVHDELTERLLAAWHTTHL